MKKKLLILTILSVTLFAVNYKDYSAGKVKAAGAVVDEADWNKKVVSITIPTDYRNYQNIGSEKYTLDSVGVWQWGSKTLDGRYTVYFDASDIKKVAYWYENEIRIPERHKANCALREATERALR